jgi:hypothetical protein
MYNVGILVYTAIQLDQIKDAITNLRHGPNGANYIKPAHQDLWPTVQPYLIAVPCVIGLGTLLLTALAWKLYEEFAWNIYKQISADLRLKRRFLIYQVWLDVIIQGYENSLANSNCRRST